MAASVKKIGNVFSCVIRLTTRHDEVSPCCKHGRGWAVRGACEQKLVVGHLPVPPPRYGLSCQQGSPQESSCRQRRRGWEST